MKETLTLWWDESLSGIRYIDQTRLSGTFSVELCTYCRPADRLYPETGNPGSPWHLALPGYGVALAAATCTGPTFEVFVQTVKDEAGRIRTSRPTAVNLTGH